MGISGKKNVKRITVQELCVLWLHEKELYVKASTYRNYSRLVYDHIIPRLGRKRYASLNKDDLNGYISALLKSGRKDGSGGLSVGMTKDVVKAFKAISKYAHMEYGLKNICEGITVPKSKAKEARSLTNRERKKLESYLINRKSLTDICVLLCLYTGLRIGELCGLQWKNINFRQGCLSVEKTVQRISLGNGKTEISIDTPKTESSVRKVYIPSFVLELLKGIKEAPEAFILSGADSPMEPRTLQYQFKKILKYSGIQEVSFHTLRHTYASMCIEKAFDVKTLSELLGHSDTKITLNTYVHSSDSLKKKYVRRFAI